MKIPIAMGPKHPRRGWDEGAAAVEAAITLSLLLLLILGIIEFGVALYNWNTMQLAIQQSGRFVMVNNGCNASCAESQMQNVLTTAAVCTTPSAGQICVNATTNAGTPPTPSTMTLTAAYGFNFIALTGPFTMTSQATFPLD
jgi:Flp pilus assembly protein TadG